MAKWRIVSGSREFHAFAGRDISMGWARDIANGGEHRTVSVCIAGSVTGATDLPDECRAAVRTHGRSAVNAVLDEENPPQIIGVTSTGLFPEYE